MNKIMAAFAPELITQIGALPITNTFLHTLAVDVVLVGGAYFISKNLSSIPHGIQNIIEPIIDGMYSLTESIATSKAATNKIFPFVMTFFLFILVANFTGLMPGVGTIGFFEKGKAHTQAINKAYASSEINKSTSESSTEIEKSSDHTQESSQNTETHKFIPLLRGATSDINVTLALALISVVATHVLSIQVTGMNDYLSRFFSFNPINLYVGLLELVAEFTKIISLSFRLFGNIFAGEVALHTISNLFAFIAPLPFLMLESIVSIVQALVFSILTLVFMAVLTTPHHDNGAGEVSH